MEEKEKQEEPSEAKKPAEMPAAPEPPLLMPPAIAAALVKLQGEVKTVIKGAKNEHFGNTYAELADVQTTALPLLSKHGLALTQWPISRGGSFYLRSLLVHSSGVGYQDDIELLLSKRDAQGLGSAITYTRRQTTMAYLGLSAEDDDDGNKAANRQAKPSAEQISEIRQLCIDLKYPQDQIAVRIQSLRTEDQATVALANLHKNMSERATAIKDEAKVFKPIPVFTEDRDQVIPDEVIEKADTGDKIQSNIQKHILELPITDKAKRGLVRHVTGKPFLANCSPEEAVTVAEVVAEIEAGTYEIPADWTDDSITPPVETA